MVSAAFASAQAIEGASISLPTVGTIGLIVFGGVWKLAQMLAQENAHTESLKEHVVDFERHTAEALERIERRMDTLPCTPKKCTVKPE